MVRAAVARDAVCTLRREIAKIEGRSVLAEPTPASSVGGEVTLRRNGRPCSSGPLSTGDAGFDRALGGGIPEADLLELHGAAMRDAAVTAGFALALAVLRSPRKAPPPILWVAAAQTLDEAGAPCLRGLGSLLGAMPNRFLLARARKLEDALWLTEEGLGVSSLGAVVLEVPGDSQKLNLTATRRLAARAREGGRTLLLIRQATPEPTATAAPLRLLVGPAPARPRETFGGPLAGTIGSPGFRVTISKNHSAPPATLLLDWNPHERCFSERPQNPGTLAPLSRHGTGAAPQAGTLLALQVRGAAAAGAVEQGWQRLDDHGNRRAG